MCGDGVWWVCVNGGWIVCGGCVWIVCVWGCVGGCGCGEEGWDMKNTVLE